MKPLALLLGMLALIAWLSACATTPEEHAENRDLARQAVRTGLVLGEAAGTAYLRSQTLPNPRGFTK